MGGGKHKAVHKHIEKQKSTFSLYAEKLETITKSRWVVIALLILPMIFAAWFRLYPVGLSITDNWAESTINNQIISQAESQIRQDFPLLPPTEVRNQALKTIDQYKAQNPAQYQQQKELLSEQFRSQLQLTFDKRGDGTYEQTYLIAIDPHYYLRRAENVVDHGNVCDEVVDGKCMDTLMLAPNGVQTQNDWHSFVGAFFILVAAAFGFSSMTGFFFIPPIFAALSTIPAFFIVKKRAGAFGGFIAATIVATHAAFLGRTPAGFVDTDVWNVFFPLYIAWALLSGLDRNDKWGYVQVGVAALLTGIYAKFWAGWYFTFFILLLVLIGTTLFRVVRQYLAEKSKLNIDAKKRTLFELLRPGIDLGIYVLGTGLFVTIFVGFKNFISAFLAPLGMSLSIQAPTNAQLWPNVLTTVAELNTVSIPSIIGQLGGRAFIIAAAIGLLYFAVREQEFTMTHWAALGGALLYYVVITSTKALTLHFILYFALFALPLIATLIYVLLRKQEASVHYGLFLMGWLVASMFATTLGARFSLLIVPIFALAIGFAGELALLAIPPLFKKELSIPAVYGKAIVILVVCMLMFMPATANLLGTAKAVGKNEVPSMNDGWYAALTAIKEDSKPDAIITSWWDFGHWFKYYAQRKVSFDGASQTDTNAHWVGLMLQTDDPKLSMGILRMIDCGHDDAYNDIFNYTNGDALRAYKITRSLLTVSKKEAHNILLQEGMSEQLSAHVLENTHCVPPEAYVITSEDMVGKAGVWAHFGLWDFNKAYVYEASQKYNKQTAIKNISERLAISSEEATRLYSSLALTQTSRDANTWISPWPGYAGVGSCTPGNQTTTCSIGMQIATQQGVPIIAHQLLINNSQPQNATITLTAQGRVVGTTTPAKLYLDGKKYAIGGDFGLAMRVDGTRLIIADDLLVNSMFTQWFYDEKPGAYMSLLTKQTQVTGGKILVYKIDWDAYIADLNDQ